MHLARYRQNHQLGIAAGNDRELHGLTADAPGYPGDLDTLLTRGADLAAIGRELLQAPLLDPGQVQWLPPVARPGKILCVGLNYVDHSKETGIELPKYPTIFTRFATTLVGSGDAIVKPAGSDQLDYEGELVAVIGKAGRAIPAQRALEHVAGYSIFNDVSVRDYQFRASQWTLGKNFDASGPFGPWLVLADALPPGGRGLRLETRLNGKTVQTGNTADLVFDVASLIVALSEVMTLEPGDLLVTGTPAGVGFTREPPLFLGPGDTCEVEIEDIGVLRNPVVAAP